MLRVYCSWPGVSAMMKRRSRRREVAVGDVDGDALLALGRRPSVRSEKSIVRPASGARASRAPPRAGPRRCACASWRRRPISVDLPSSTLPTVGEAQEVRPLFRATKLASGRGRGPHSEVAFALLLLHRAVAVVIDHARGALRVPRRPSSSSMISSNVAAVERTAPVQGEQPSVRKRHITALELSRRQEPRRGRTPTEQMSCSPRTTTSRSRAK